MEVIMGCDGELWSQPDARHKLALARLAEVQEEERGNLRTLLAMSDEVCKCKSRIAELEAENAALRAALPVPTGLRQVAALVRCCMMSEEVEA